VKRALFYSPHCLKKNLEVLHGNSLLEFSVFISINLLLSGDGVFQLITTMIVVASTKVGAFPVNRTIPSL
jgi:hypothetical protein